ncbi:MAG: NAD(P)/FAD-dependent oxidoreductase [Thomasclavelia ramosa]
METTVIIGAGASGLICGHELAKNHHNVIILEQSNKPGRKILASGNGRCNLSNTNLDMYFYNTDDKRIEKIIHSFDAQAYFNEIGVLTRQVGTLLYPRTNQSLTIKNALMNNFDQVALIEECKALKIIKKEHGYLVDTTKGKYECNNVVIATGSPASLLSGENSYDLVKMLDLTVTKLYPSLVQLKTRPSYAKLKGVRVKCKTSLLVDDCLIESQDGEVLFSDQGLSGICIMQLSRLLSRYDGKKEISLDLLPEYDYKQAEFLLNERKENMVIII